MRINGVIALALSASVLAACGQTSAGTQPASGPLPNLRSAAVRPPRLVAVGIEAVLTSNDGTTWSARRLPFQADKVLFGAYCGRQRDWIFGTGGAIFTSSDGTSWNRLNRVTGATLLGMTAARSGQLVAVGSSGVIVRSADGLKWSVAHRGGPRLQAVGAAGTGYIAVGISGTILRGNAAGTQWQLASSTTTDDLADVASLRGRTIVVGKDGTILASAGGKWAPVKSGTMQNLWGIAASPSAAVAVGGAGVILRTTDGTSWQRVRGVTRRPLIGIRYAGGTFVAVGYEGSIYTSADGLTWTKQDAGGAWHLLRVC